MPVGAGLEALIRDGDLRHRRQSPTRLRLQSERVPAFGGHWFMGHDAEVREAVGAFAHQVT